MDGAAHVVLADDDTQFCQLVTEHIAVTPGLELSAAVHDGVQALAAVQSFRPDILTLDLVMPELDGLGVLRVLRQSEFRPRVLVLTETDQEAVVQQAFALGADYCVMKPFDMPTLMQRLRQLVEPRRAKRPFRLEQRQQRIERAITEYITCLGVPPHYKGYAYLRDAIALVVEDTNLLTQVTKVLYPSIAAKHDTSATKVERAIRHAIEVTWTKGNLDAIHRFFTYTVDMNKGKPTNASFIAQLADQVRLELRVPAALG